MKNKKIFFALFFILTAFSLVSANGLIVQSDNPISINKTYGQDVYIDLTIKNSESFNFSNIFFEDDSGIEFDEPFNLSSGENKTVRAKITADIDGTINTKIKGAYFTNLGDSNETINVNIDSDEDGHLDFDSHFESIIKGAKINWINNLDYGVYIAKMVNGISTGSEMVGPNSNSSLPQAELGIFYFRAEKSSFVYSDICTVNVLDTDGYVIDDAYDALFSINLNMEYPETNISVYIPEKEYVLDFADSDEGIITVTNNGDKTMVNAYLKGKWIDSFSPNNFNLEPGKTKTVSYIISSSGNIYQTSQTNKTYDLNFSITGNFPEYNDAFNVFIPYTYIGNGSQEFDYADISAYIDYCDDNPEDPICPDEKIVYIFTNTSDNSFNTSLTQDQFKELLIKSMNFYSDYELDTASQNEKIDDFNETINSMLSVVNNSLGATEDRDSSFDKFKDSQNAFTFLMLGIIVGLGGFFFIRDLRIKKKREKEIKYY